LAGSPVGVKDIISIAAVPTRYGMVQEAGPREDAWCVARLRQLGAAILGKTACIAFA
jgi:Asp-tRNA(Asn)/Glu-tRNA(Gln) amidotransferase A subunit family amidase